MAKVACEGRGKNILGRENAIIQVLKAKKVYFTVVQDGFGVKSIWGISGRQDWKCSLKLYCRDKFNSYLLSTCHILCLMGGARDKIVDRQAGPFS